MSYILTFWPGQKYHSKVMHRKEVTHSNGSYERKSRGWKLADEMGRAKKFPWYTHRLMHRKRVTSELHDSYFRLMTIKHSISKIKWPSNDYITQLSSTSQLSCRQLERRCGKENHTRPKILIRCSKESQHPAGVDPRAPIEHKENKKDTMLMAIKEGVKILQLCLISSSLSHANFE